MNAQEALDDGFVPLRKTPTMPKLLTPSKPHMQRGLSFNGETGEKEDSQALWNSSSYMQAEKSRGRLLERANSFIGNAKSIGTKDGAVAIVDPFSTGAHLALAITRAGYKCVRVFSIWDSPVASLVQEGITVEFCATLQHNDQEANQDAATDATVKQLRELPFPILAVIPGAETGVELADRLSSRLKLRSNGEAGSFARRNKYAMGEAVRAAGVRAVKQQACTDIPSLHTFLDTLPQNPFKCVVKPVQSAGSDDVFLCNTYEEAEVAFHRINGKRNGLGLINECALVQEYLRGKEYVVDQVSRDGVHKIVCIWEYDKRLVNGAAFVYFGMKLCRSDTKVSQELIAYANRVLDALGIMQGPSHMEVMYNPHPDPREGGGPCLVEVGSRCHGGEGTWLPIVNESIGYSQVSITADVYLSGPLFDQISPTQYPFSKYGMDCDMVSRSSGIVRGFPCESIIRDYPSFKSISWEVHVGDFCPLTIDCFTRPGVVQLMHESEEQIVRDFERYHRLHETGDFIDYSVICPVPPTTGTVVVVDPFASGAHLAALVLQWGYKLIMVLTQQQESGGAKHSQTLLSQYGTHYKPTLLIQHTDRDGSSESALQATLDLLQKQQDSSPILAILPGSASGVLLAERLAGRVGTRSNDLAGSVERQDKLQFQSVLAHADSVRTISQQHCAVEGDVTAFWNTHKLERAVVKPRQSSGNDSVILCRSLEEAVYAFNSIHGHKNVHGVTNEGALIQEYVPGTEYVVHGVSRSGRYKITSLWKYDKRTVNGSDFVPFSLRVVDPNSSAEGVAVVELSKKVIQTTGLREGPSTVKIIYSSDNKCPILINCCSSCFQQDGSWIALAKECVGYSQVDILLSAYIRPDGFDVIPSVPAELTAEGIEVYLISNKTGVVRDVVGLDAIRELPSCRRVDLLAQPGSLLTPTSDYYSRVGTVLLVNSDAKQLEADYETIRAMELNHGLVKLI